MINEIFQSIHESVKKRNKPEDFLPNDYSGRDVIHRGYLNRSIYPIKYDIIPDGKTKNTGKHIYNFKSGGAFGVLEIDHKYQPMKTGHETKSLVHFELEGRPPEDVIQVYRSFVVPSFLHHLDSHRPDIISFSDSVINIDDLIRRAGTKFELDPSSSSMIRRLIDPKILRLIKHFKGESNAHSRTR